MDRVQAIAECVDTIALCVEEEAPGNWSALLGEMDMRVELHRLVWGGDSAVRSRNLWLPPEPGPSEVHC
jgi:hypothetical protein